MRYLCKVSYDGTSYCGWQKQLKLHNSIQECIEERLKRILNSKIVIYGAGRTDKGVHAFAQYFHFDSERSIENLGKFVYSLNRLLPDDIKILSIASVSDDFHARFQAKEKKYLYKINTNPKNPFSIRYEYQLMRGLDINKMTEASNIFVGKHNFMNFTSKTTDSKEYIRNIYTISITDQEGLISIVLVGDGFMRYMVRMIVGALIQVGLKKVSIDELKSLFVFTPRKIVKYKAPANGLYLLDIVY